MAHRLYANENFPLPVVEALRASGHDVLTSFDAGQANQGVPDEDVLRFAVADERAVVTFNRKHFIRLHAMYPNHKGIIVCSVDPNLPALAERIHDAITLHSDIAQQLIRVNRPPGVSNVQ